jgi:hypothetical protein
VIVLMVGPRRTWRMWYQVAAPCLINDDTDESEAITPAALTA